MDAPTWWADVQQDRDNLVAGARRSADLWLQEDVDFVPRRRLTRTTGPMTTSGPIELELDADHPLHGVFVAAETPRVIELVSDPLTDRDLAPLDDRVAAAIADDDAYLSPPPPAGQRRTVQITGRPAEAAIVSRARRHRPRTTADRIGGRPDRIALWAVVLGAVLIILAVLSSSSQAAEIAHHATLLAPR
jgi:hypothetical protein